MNLLLPLAPRRHGPQARLSRRPHAGQRWNRGPASRAGLASVPTAALMGTPIHPNNTQQNSFQTLKKLETVRWVACSSHGLLHIASGKKQLKVVLCLCSRETVRFLDFFAFDDFTTFNSTPSQEMRNMAARLPRNGTLREARKSACAEIQESKPATEQNSTQHLFREQVTEAVPIDRNTVDRLIPETVHAMSTFEGPSLANSCAADLHTRRCAEELLRELFLSCGSLRTALTQLQERFVIDGNPLGGSVREH